MKCCICGKTITERHSNDPAPYMLKGRCCDACNAKYVVPARLADIHKAIRATGQIRP